MIPLVSVVIPTYNRSRDLQRALRSVMAQTLTNWEAIVVDGYSDDDSEAMVERLSEPRIAFRKMRNEGLIAAGRNRGIEEARGEYIAFLDSDDWWSPDKLLTALQPLLAGADLVYHDLRIVRRVGERLTYRRMRPRRLEHPLYDDLITRGNTIATSSVVVRASQIRNIGGFFEDRPLNAAEDYECWLRLSRVTERFTLLPETLGSYWLGGGNTTTPVLSLRNLARLRELHIDPHIAERGLDTPAWVLYHTGRSLFLTGAYEAAAPSLRAVLRSRASAILKLRAAWMLAMLAMHLGRR